VLQNDYVAFFRLVRNVGSRDRDDSLRKVSFSVDSDARCAPDSGGSAD
jgi:hypothetical protein